MDYQILFNLAVATAAFFGGWVLNSISASIRQLDKDVRRMPDTYVRQTDYHRDIGEVKTILTKIWDRLEDKADK